MNFLISSNILFFVYIKIYNFILKKKSLKENQAGEIGINVNDLENIILVH